ncbi:hypothetical protein BH10PAT4_BH10PAT4_3520 [soil metagenome]
MNKKTVFIILGLLIIIIGAILYVILRPKENLSDVYQPTTSSTKEEVPSTDNGNGSPVAASTQPGVYKDYTDQSIASTSGTKLLFFHAPWCPQCRSVEASINDNGVPSGVTVFKVDYDTNQALRQKYGVTIQTTFVKVDNDGNKIASYVAYDEPNFSSVERELLR